MVPGEIEMGKFRGLGVDVQYMGKLFERAGIDLPMMSHFLCRRIGLLDQIATLL